MADNTTLPVGVGGDTIRTIQRGQTKTQVIQLDIGGEAGPESLVVSNNPLPVVPVGTTAVTGAVAVTNFPVVQAVSGTVAISNTIAGIPPTGSATSASSLPVVIASDQVVPVQFQPDQLGAAGMDAALPVTIALDQPSIAVQIAPTGQLPMLGSVPVVLASDQSPVPVAGTFWQATQPVSIAAAVSVKPDGVAWTQTGTAANVNIVNSLTVAGIPPLGNASSVGALPVVIASDQVVPVQFNPDTLGPSVMDGALPVTLALDQPPVPIVQTQLGQQLMQQSIPVTLAMDQTSVVVTANQGVSPFNIAGPVSVTNFPGTQLVSGIVAVSNLPATQAVSVAALPLPANAAQETSGNLATLVTLTQQMQQLIELNKMSLAALRANNLLLASLGGASVNPGDLLDDVTFQ